MVVTGASGFIGRRLVAALRRAGHDPVTDRVDVTDPAALAQWASVRPQVVFHLAVSRDPNCAQAVNVSGTEHVLAAAGSARVVHLGGALEADADSVYGASKAAASRAALAAGAVVVRPTFVYGPGQAPRKLIPTVLRAARDGETVEVVQAAPVDWVHVDDVVAACLRAVTAEAGTRFDVASGESHSPEEVIDAAEVVTGRRIARRPSDVPPRPWDRTRAAVDSAPLVDGLGIRPRGLRAGLELTWKELR